MAETSLSLLDRLRDPGQPAAWDRMVDVYTPFLHRWLGEARLQSSDTEDLIQDVLASVVRAVPTFRHGGRTGSFRAWLRTITANRLRDFWRSRAATAPADAGRLADDLEASDSRLSRAWDLEHDRFVLDRLMNLIEPEFAPETWSAFRRHVLEGGSADEVATSLGVTPNVVFIAKSRVLRRLREEAQGLVDDGEAA